MVDCHRHAWEGQIRGVIPNSATIGDSMGATHRGFAPFYHPDDMYVGNLITALGCIDAGITCFIDNSHSVRWLTPTQRYRRCSIPAPAPCMPPARQHSPNGIGNGRKM
jgi:cytosine/adenosine deaminase-related metal-dependent hydrolase